MLWKGRGGEGITGTRASFVDANTVKLEGATIGTIKFQNAVIATGSLPTMPKAFALGDPRIMDSTGALLLPDLPKRLLVIAGRYTGLEIGNGYPAPGPKIPRARFTTAP